MDTHPGPFQLTTNCSQDRRNPPDHIGHGFCTNFFGCDGIYIKGPDSGPTRILDVTDKVMEPEESVEYLGRILDLMPFVAVASIAGPEDPFYEPKRTLKTLERPRISPKCATACGAGPMLPDYWSPGRKENTPPVWGTFVMRPICASVSQIRISLRFLQAENRLVSIRSSQALAVGMATFRPRRPTSHRVPSTRRWLPLQVFP